jgi:hypothetical protein
MKDSVLDWPERELLGILIRLHSWRGPVTQDTLAVAARGRGLAVSRPLARLKAMGLIEEVKRKPFILLRLLGHRAECLVVPSEAALSQDWWREEKTVHFLSAVPQVAQVIQGSEPAPKLFSARPPILIDLNAPLKSQANAAPVRTTAPNLRELAPETSSDIGNSALISSLAHPVRRASSGFTEDLGGVPNAENAVNQAHMVDASTLAGIQEMLESFGMELTAAGEVLIADRMASGASPGDALVQVVLYAFGHAARHGMISERAFLGLSLSDFAVFVMQELEKLRDSGAICELRFEDDMKDLWSMVNNSTEGLEKLLADPIGGAAPPALLPQDMHLSDDE